MRQPGNRFVSFVRARGLVARWEWIQSDVLWVFPFPFWPWEAFPFPFLGSAFPFSLDQK